MAEQPKRHRLRRTLLYVLGGLILFLVAFHFWFVYHAEDLIENLVHTQSNGRLELKVKKFRFNWFSREIELRNATFFSTDSVNAPNAYRFQVSRIEIQLKALLPVIFEKRFMIDSMRVIDPHITITKLRADAKDITADDEELSIPQEMGRVYKSIQDALQVLSVDKFQIDNGTFSLVNKLRPEDKPLSISRIYFHLENFMVDTATETGTKKILFSDNVSLRTSNQDILFPDGRHRMAFKNFRINILNRLAEFDSCTISATRADSSGNSFSVFFDKLKMTNINFDTLYQTEVIKADSVYCINPKFKLDLNIASKNEPSRPPPQLNELVQQLTGDMELGFVVVQNASIDVNTVRDGKPSSFSSSKNNFDLQGLRVRQHALRPLTLERFAMAIRNYETFLKDSAYSMKFDSILINNNRISLSNFGYQELKNGRVMNSLYVPQFELFGMSWDDLIVDQQLKAEKINLYSPVIDYRLNGPGEGKGGGRSQDVFQTLAGLGDILQLQDLNIRNGQITLQFGNQSSLQLDQTFLEVSTQQLVTSKRIRTIQRSVKELFFSNGVLRSGNVTARLKDAKLKEGGLGLTASTLMIENKGLLQVTARGVSLEQLLIDEGNKQNTINGLSWNQADVKLTGNGSGKPAGPADFELRNITGANTSFSVQDDQKSVKVLLKTIEADHLKTQNGKLLLLTGIRTQGSGLAYTAGNIDLTVNSFNLQDRNSSTLKGIVFQNITGHDSLSILTPTLTVVPDLDQILQGKISSTNVIVDQPVIDLYSGAKATNANPTPLPPIRIDHLLVRQPVVNVRSEGEKGLATINWSGTTGDNFIEVDGLKNTETAGSGRITIDGVKLALEQFVYLDAAGKRYDAGKGRFTSTLADISLQRNDLQSWDWKGSIKDLYARDFVLDSLGKRKGRMELKFARLSDFAVSSASLLNMRDLVSQNKEFRLTEITGNYQDSVSRFEWNNLAYDKRSRLLTLDTFDYHPLDDKPTYMSKQEFQTDYITGRTGRLTIGPFDIDRYIRDTVLQLGIVHIDHGYFSSYRDKRMTRKPGKQTHLPIGMIRQIPEHIIVDSVVTVNGRVDYEETNQNNGQTGRVEVLDLNATIVNLRNYEISEGDSLSLNVRGLVAGGVPTYLQTHASYADTIEPFRMTVHMDSADLRVLNPVLRPLASAELRSGYLDSLDMTVLGHDHHAVGEMHMYYHDLNIRVIKTGTRNTNFFTRLATFAVNTLVKNENKKHRGVVYLKRFRDRSAVNYLVKITMNGVISSVGLKGNRKQLKRYRNETRRSGVKPIDSPFSNFPISLTFTINSCLTN